MPCCLPDSRAKRARTTQREQQLVLVSQEQPVLPREEQAGLAREAQREPRSSKARSSKEGHQGGLQRLAGLQALAGVQALTGLQQQEAVLAEVFSGRNQQQQVALLTAALEQLASLGLRDSKGDLQGEVHAGITGYPRGGV